MREQCRGKGTKRPMSSPEAIDAKWKQELPLLPPLLIAIGSFGTGIECKDEE